MINNYTCPRCNGNRIIDTGDTIECVDCGLEFDKEDIKILKADQILSIKEKLAFIKSIKE